MPNALHRLITVAALAAVAAAPTLAQDKPAVTKPAATAQKAKPKARAEAPKLAIEAETRAKAVSPVGSRRTAPAVGEHLMNYGDCHGKDKDSDA